LRDGKRQLDWNHYLLERACNGELRRRRSWVLRLTANGMGGSESGLRIGPEGVARATKRGRRGAWVLVDFDFLGREGEGFNGAFSWRKRADDETGMSGTGRRNV
jgi:hypothetical protein